MSQHEQTANSQQNPEAEVWRFTHSAMACTWQLFVAGEERDYAENVSYVAWDELERLERELSRFITASEVTQVNCAAPGEVVTLALATMECCSWRAKYMKQQVVLLNITVGSVLDARP
jgi:thiamine biosynthesis lipoprotein ApbE